MENIMTNTNLNNVNLHNAKLAKDDEYYTRMSDIEKELSHYPDAFSDKVVYCNCDCPRNSNFVKYFTANFKKLGLKKLVSTCYVDNGYGKLFIKTARAEKTSNLKGSGSFDSDECIEISKTCDIIATNPPFSIARTKYLPFLISTGKQFIILGDLNWVTYKNIFPLFKDGVIWTGYNRVPKFERPDGSITQTNFGNKIWFTNLDVSHRHMSYNTGRNLQDVPHVIYDGTDIVGVHNVSDIPCDYCGLLGVPVSYMQKYCPEQYELVGIDRYIPENPHYGKRFTVSGKESYARIVIKKIKHHLETQI